MTKQELLKKARVAYQKGDVDTAYRLWGAGKKLAGLKVPGVASAYKKYLKEWNDSFKGSGINQVSDKAQTDHANRAEKLMKESQRLLDRLVYGDPGKDPAKGAEMYVQKLIDNIDQILYHSAAYDAMEEALKNL